MATKSIYKLDNERITSDSIVHEESNEYINLKEYLNKFKTEIENSTKYQPGDTLEILNASMDFVGCVTGSAKGLHFTIFTQKKLDNINNVQVDILKANTRISGGGYLDNKSYVSGGYDYKELYSCTATVKSSNSIKIIVEKSSSFTNTTNNIPVTVSIEDIKLIFS